MENVHHLESWRDLYVMLGTSSAALLGLLYVVTSLHLDEIVNNSGYRRRARSNSIYLMITLVEAALILAPQPMWSLGVELAALNGYGSYLSIKNIIFIYKNRNSAKRGGFAMHRAIVFNTSFLLGIVAGACLVGQANWGVYLVTASYVTLLISVALNAWSIMLGVGETEKAGKTSRGATRRARA